jgi:hypothetical protein
MSADLVRTPEKITIGGVDLPTGEIQRVEDTRLMVSVDTDAIGGSYVAVPTDEPLTVTIPDGPTFKGRVTGIQFEHGVVLHIEHSKNIGDAAGGEDR